MWPYWHFSSNSVFLVTVLLWYLCHTTFLVKIQPAILVMASLLLPVLRFFAHQCTFDLLSYWRTSRCSDSTLHLLTGGRVFHHTLRLIYQKSTPLTSPKTKGCIGLHKIEQSIIVTHPRGVWRQPIDLVFGLCKHSDLSLECWARFQHNPKTYFSVSSQDWGLVGEHLLHTQEV